MNPARHCKRSGGFTLIEVMIVVAVIGILAAIALPTFQQHVLRAKGTDGPSTLAQLKVKMEQYYDSNHRYNVAPGNPDDTNCGVTVSDSDSKYFAYTCRTSSSGQNFVITATGKAAAGTGLFTYTVDQANNRKTTGLPPGWGTYPQPCWITAKGQGC